MEISERLQAAIDAVDDLTYAEWNALKTAKDDLFEDQTRPLMERAFKEACKVSSGLMCEITPEEVGQGLKRFIG